MPRFQVAKDWLRARIDQWLIRRAGADQHPHVSIVLAKLACDQTAELSSCAHDQLHECAWSITCCTAVSAVTPSVCTGSR